MNYELQIKKTKNSGYTIIETMVAISVFLIVVMMGMGALLNANLLHSKSQNMRSIMDNLSFIMDDMSRNLRTGYDYHCDSLSNPNDCTTYNLFLAFKESKNNEQWVYQIYSTDSINYNIRKSTAGGAENTWIQLNSDEIKIDSTQSGFKVIGVQVGDNIQPYVTINLVGKITYKGVDTPFNLQTSVSQRSLDR